MSLREETLKLRKYPTAAAALVFAAVFSFLLAPEGSWKAPSFYLVWLLGVLLGIHIWCMFRADRSYRVSGIVPAWLELGIGTALLIWCPVRELSLIFVMLSVCSYAAGIIFSVKVTTPLVLLLGIAPRAAEINALINDAMTLVAGRVWLLFGAVTPPPPAMPGSAELFWGLLLALFPLSVKICRTAYDRFAAYCMAFPLFIVTDLFRNALLVRTGGGMMIAGSYAAALACGTAVLALVLYLIRRLPETLARNGKGSDR